MDDKQSEAEQAVSLTALVEEQLAAAREAPAGRAAHTVYGGRGRVLRQALMVLLAGRSLDDHESPGDATLQVLRGRVRLATAEASRDVATGEIVPIPATRHRLEALEDAAVLLTVAKRPD